MNKELEALEDIILYLNASEPKGLYCENIETIQQALQRLEAIDNAIEICKKANEQKYVYIKETYGIIKSEFLDDLDYEILNNRLYVNSRGIYYNYPLKDYGNWWALTKEELENE